MTKTSRDWRAPESLEPQTAERRSDLLALGAIAVTVLLWASAFVAIRYVGREMTAGSLALGRLAVASLLLGALLLVRRPQGPDGQPDRAWPSRQLWPYLIICGVVWLGGYNLALNEAERRVDAGTAAMLVGIGPLLIPLLAGLVLKEGLPARLVTGCAVAFAGAVVIGASSTTGTSSDVWGILLSIAAAVAYAIGVVTQKPLLSQMSALRVTWLACTIGLIVCLPYAPALVRELGTVSPASIWWMVYLGAAPTALAFTTWAYALSRSTAGRLGATTYLVPPIAVLMGWLLLGESPALLAIAGGALCLAGVSVARRAPRPVPAR
jgi:drug/metabolite transporter (DMT)-like permease